jgi:hypothetical protein
VCRWRFCHSILILFLDVALLNNFKLYVLALSSILGGNLVRNFFGLIAFIPRQRGNLEVLADGGLLCVFLSFLLCRLFCVSCGHWFKLLNLFWLCLLWYFLLGICCCELKIRLCNHRMISIGYCHNKSMFFIRNCWFWSGSPYFLFRPLLLVFLEISRCDGGFPLGYGDIYGSKFCSGWDRLLSWSYGSLLSWLYIGARLSLVMFYFSLSNYGILQDSFFQFFGCGRMLLF